MFESFWTHNFFCLNFPNSKTSVFNCSIQRAKITYEESVKRVRAGAGGAEEPQLPPEVGGSGWVRKTENHKG